MRTPKQSISNTLIGLTLAAAALGIVGCPSALEKDRLSATNLPPFSEQDAIILAKLEAKSEGVWIEAYDISTRQRKDSWWVHFQQRLADPIRNTSKARRWPYRFIVEVSPTGEIRLMKNL